MKRCLTLLLLGATQCLAQSAPNVFTQPNINIVGPGCTTVFYIDPLCKPVGTGMKSSGVYPVSPLNNWAGNVTLNGTTTLTVNSTSSGGPLGPGAVLTGTDIPTSPVTVIVSGTPGGTTFVMSAAATGSATENITATPAVGSTPAWYTLGDSPDADPNSLTIGTTTQWENYWITTTSCVVAWASCTAAQQNQALINYLTDDFAKSLPSSVVLNTASIYYVSLSGSNSTGTVNRPDLPYATVADAFTALKATTQTFAGTATTVSGSPVLTVTAASSGALVRSSLLGTATGIPAATYIRQQITQTGSAGGVGTYLMTANATASGSISITAGTQSGGFVMIEAGPWPGCTSGSPGSACLNLQRGYAGNPSWTPSGSPNGWLVIMGFPGAALNFTPALGSVYGTGDMIDLDGADAPGKASCCLILSGLQAYSSEWDDGQSQGSVNIGYFSDLIVQDNEFAGWDKLPVANSQRVTIQHNVFHESYAHGIYNDWATGCALSSPGTDTDFSQDVNNMIAGIPCTGGATFGLRIVGNVFYDCAANGSDCIHLNGWDNGPVITGNTFAFSGYCISAQTGIYHALINGNLCIDDASEGVLLYEYTNFYAVATFGANSNQITVATISSLPLADAFEVLNGYYVYGTDIPSGLPGSAGATTFTAIPGGGGAGTYTLSQNTTGAASTAVPIISGGNNGGSNDSGPSTLRWNSILNNVIWQGAPTDYIFGGNPSYGIRLYDKTGVTYIKNTTIQGNTIVWTNNGGGNFGLAFQVASCQGDSGYPCASPIYVQPTTSGPFPETTTVTANTFYGLGSNTDVMEVDPLASQGGSSPFPLAGGTYTFASFSTYYPSNTYAGSTPLPGVTESCVYAPGTCTVPTSLWH